MQAGEIGDISKATLSRDLANRKIIRRFLQFAKQVCSTYKNTPVIVERLHKGMDKVLQKHPHNPSLKTGLEFLLPLTKLMHQEPDHIIIEIQHRYNLLEAYYYSCDERISFFINKKIRSKGHLFAYALSHHMINGIMEAVAKHKKFTLHIAEQAHTGYGKKLAQTCAKQGIKVYFYPDSALHLGIQRSDFVLLGTTRIDYDGNAYNEVGAEMVGQLAHAFDKPLYICADALKYDTDARKNAEIVNANNEQTIWNNYPKYVSVVNVAEEKLHKDLITSIICELGILGCDEYISSITKTYPDWFRH